MATDQVFIDEIVAPSQARDVGVKVTVGPPRPVMLCEKGNRSWGQFAFPSMWRLRDGRLVCFVTIGEDEMPSDADFHYLWYISDDEGRHWIHAVITPEEAEAFLRERVTLPSGRQVYYVPKYVSFDAIGARPYREFSYERSGYGFAFQAIEVVYRLGDLSEHLRCVTRYTRHRSEETWQKDQAYMDEDLLLPLFVEKVFPNADSNRMSHGLIATPLRCLSEVVGDDRLPDVGVLCHNGSRFATHEDLRTGFGQDAVARVHIPPPSLARLHHLSHEQLVELEDESLILPTGIYTSQLVSTLGRPELNRCMNIFRSDDGGRYWKHYSRFPELGDGRYTLCWPFQITTNMPAGNWLAVLRTAGRGWTGNSLLMISRSYDQGLTWTTPVAIRPHSVNPVGGRLRNGVVFRMYGRPGQYVTFCSDGEGKSWGSDITIMPPVRDSRSPTGFVEISCCNSDVLVTGPDRFLVVYTDYNYKDQGGRIRRGVLVREVVARPG